ncbi:hypothetical protein DOY81_007658 [Sarcophaga bullata]|nr:hypothetical protein DOY81_007658 [Sarcophaga bullata]
MSDEKEYDFDLIVIGGGSGGLACAKEANTLCAKVAIVDYVKPTPKGNSWGLGGACINVGCIPKKLMHTAALLSDDVHDATFYGWKIPNEEDITLSWSQLVTEIQNHIKSTIWVTKVDLRLRKIPYFNGMASFVDQHTILVKMKDGQEMQITAQYIVIAIGRRPVYPDIPGDREYGITSDDLFSLPKPPGKTLIVGAGYVTTECAGFLRVLGFDVTVMVRNTILRNVDEQMVLIITESLKERGIKFLIPYKPLKVEELPSGSLKVTYQNCKTLTIYSQIYDTVVWAIGRKAPLKDLNVEAINLLIEKDNIVVNNKECTNIDNIYAVGDVTKGRPQLSPVAVKAGQYLARRLFGNSIEVMNYENIPVCMYTPLEYCYVGMTEELAKQKYGNDNIEVYHSHYSPLEFSLPEKVNEFCYIKIITKQEDNQLVLGIHFIGPNAGEVIQGFAVALNCGLYMKTLINTIGTGVTNSQEITKTFITKRSGFNKISYDEEWDSDDDIPLSRLRRSNSTELVVNLAPKIHNSYEITDWLNDEIETTDDETDENDKVKPFNEECCNNNKH